MATFEWDGSRSRRNRIAHGVAFEDAVSAFADPIMFTERGERVRVISAGRATSTECRQYEEASR
jgi:uncharacterized DUF497 family protein